MTFSRPFSTAQEALASFLDERRRRPELELQAWLKEQEAAGLEVPDGVLEFRERLVLLAHEAVRGVPAEEGRGSAEGALLGFQAGSGVGSFVLEGEIGAGGMGVVWKAHERGTGQAVAIKFMVSWGRGGEDRARFLREAEAGLCMVHPGLVRTLDTGVERGVPWIAMEHVDGQRSLATEIRVSLEQDIADPERVERAVQWVHQVALALSALHEQGYVHRDLKPSNVFLDPKGVVKVGDFGLVRPLGEVELTSSLTRLGTVAYMSPEQVRGERVDPRSDVFSLGILFYELLTLGRPFSGGSPAEVARRILEREVPPPHSLDAQVPKGLSWVVLRALEKAPASRFQTALELAVELERYQRGEPLLTRGPSVWRRSARWARRHPGISTFASTMTLLLVLVTALFLRLEKSNDALLARELELQVPAVDQRIDLLMVALEDLGAVDPAHLDAMRSWLGRAREIVGTLGSHELASGREHPGLRALIGTSSPRTPVARGADSLLASLVERVEALGDEEFGPMHEAVRPDFGWGVAHRIERAEYLADLFSNDQQLEQAWREARDRIQGNDLYGGLDLPIQVGLVPLGTDPESGLEEFWHVLTGEKPVRGADGHLEYVAESGVVLVLLPGGEFLLGAQSKDPRGPNYDPSVAPLAKPPQLARVSPFFLSKFECTIAQWERLRGEDPSSNSWRHYSNYGHDMDGTCPVTGTGARQAILALEQVGLELPSDLQWEYAARAESGTPWWTGDEPSDLATAANLLDRSAQKTRPNEFENTEPWSDGFTLVAPAQRLRPNPFGLHHVHGNVSEYLRTGQAPAVLPDPLPLDWEVPRASDERDCFRGGSYMNSASYSASSVRHAQYPGKSSRIGLRPSCRIED